MLVFTISNTSNLNSKPRMIRSDFLDAVGNTSLIKLRKASELTGCNILGKAEFMNPGGSVKDLSLIHI